MLVGRSPFFAPDAADPSANEQEPLMARIKAGAFRVPRGVSAAAADLIRRLLVQDPAARLTPAEVLDHAWVRKHCSSSSSSGAPGTVA